jgi:hypothetical protein
MPATTKTITAIRRMITEADIGPSYITFWRFATNLDANLWLQPKGRQPTSATGPTSCSFHGPAG